MAASALMRARASLILARASWATTTRGYASSAVGGSNFMNKPPPRDEGVSSNFTTTLKQQIFQAKKDTVFGLPEKPMARTDRIAGSFRNMEFVKNILDEDEQSSRRTKKDIVHILLVKKKTFVTVTDAKGNKKTGASAGSVGDRKGQSRLSRYAAEATAEHVGRSAKKIGTKSVVMKVKGCAFFRKKRKVILSWRDGFRGEGLGTRSGILSVQDVTQLPHNGCRLPKKRRI